MSFSSDAKAELCRAKVDKKCCAIAESYGHMPDNRYYQIGFVPMAGFTMMGSMTVKF